MGHTAAGEMFIRIMEDGLPAMRESRYAGKLKAGTKRNDTEETPAPDTHHAKKIPTDTKPGRRERMEPGMGHGPRG